MMGKLFIGLLWAGAAVLAVFIFITVFSPENETADNEANTVEGTETTENETNSEPNEKVTTDNKTNSGDTISTDMGEMTVVKQITEAGSFESGPMVVHVNEINVLEGKLSEDYQEMLSKDADISYIEISMEVENTSEDRIAFYPGQAIITTNTGEQLTADSYFGEYMAGEFIGQVTQRGSAAFILENSTADDIQSIRMIISPPTDYENFEPINDAEEIDAEIQFN